MAKKFLNDTDVVVGLEKVGGKGVTEGVCCHALADFRFSDRMVKRRL